MTLDELENLEAELIAELRVIRNCIKEKKIAQAEKEFGVRVGSIVVNKDGKRHRVTKVDPRHSKPWVEGNPERKDGTFGTAVRNLFTSWQLEESK